MTSKRTAKEQLQVLPEGSKLTKEHVVQKLALLRTPSAKEALKEAEKACDGVVAAFTHTLAEGDLTVADFGTFRASMQGPNRIRISFSPADKLKKAVEARLSKKAGQSPKR